ncbi:hypothetical protein [Ornithinimicrobium sp. INDO-MA30-4]|uniref:hypothetical protein n=1 Tax=Ornithinimicrobium sp. INDO-MA30-4 TaxID=2908651 RepID=UPI001F22A3C6|nr:hypothetical protein [Ornithinimicrobium sp. INDO-MA30-4]UJH71373.1 hypothetical protein L0A91_06425 [Ornithinimicrobium sp. INDO-MA30-4]
MLEHGSASIERESQTQEPARLLRPSESMDDPGHFAELYVNAYNHAWLTGDSEQLADMSSSTCDLCTTLTAATSHSAGLTQTRHVAPLALEGPTTVTTAGNSSEVTLLLRTITPGLDLETTHLHSTIHRSGSDLEIIELLVTNGPSIPTGTHADRPQAVE